MVRKARLTIRALLPRNNSVRSRLLRLSFFVGRLAGRRLTCCAQTSLFSDDSSFGHKGLTLKIVLSDFFRFPCGLPVVIYGWATKNRRDGRFEDIRIRRKSRLEQGLTGLDGKVYSVAP